MGGVGGKGESVYLTRFASISFDVTADNDFSPRPGDLGDMESALKSADDVRS